MQAYLQEFDDTMPVPGWPGGALLNGWVEVMHEGHEWSLGAVQVNCYRQADYDHTRHFPSAHPRAQAIKAWIQADPGFFQLISDRIGEIVASEREIADESAFDMRRELA